MFASWKPIRTQKEGTFECKNCSKRYIQKQTLNRHLQYECGKAPQFQCPWCQYCAKQKSNLLTHIRKRHSSFLVEDPTPDLKPTQDSSSTNKTLLKWLSCKSYLQSLILWLCSITEQETYVYYLTYIIVSNLIFISAFIINI